MSTETEHTVTFMVTGLPDSAGLRIKSLSPQGIYLSSRDPEAAQWYFERCLTTLLHIHGKLIGAPGWCLSKPIDWTQAIEHGTSQAVFRILSQAEADEVRALGELVLDGPGSLILEHWTKPDKTPFMMIRDPGDWVDDWLVEALHEDILKSSALQ